MAVVPATVLDARVIRGPVDAGTNGGLKHIVVEVTITNGATQVAGGTDTLDFNADTQLRTIFRNGKTFTLRGAPQVTQVATGASASYAATVGVSSNVISLTPKTPADWTTNATIIASGLTIAPYKLQFMVEESA